MRRLTSDKLYCDREPACLPIGDVVFSSDRGCGASQCGAAPLAYSDFGLPNLFRVSADGSRLDRLTCNKDVDRDPHGFVQSYRSLSLIEPGEPLPLGEGYRDAYPGMPNLEPGEGQLYEAVKRRIDSPGGLLCLSNHMSGPEVTRPKQSGSHQSRLVLTPRDDPLHRREVSLSRDEWETLVTWVDANAPYRGTRYQYFGSAGRLLPHAVPVRIQLDPPYQRGEKTYRIVAAAR